MKRNIGKKLQSVYMFLPMHVFVRIYVMQIVPAGQHRIHFPMDIRIRLHVARKKKWKNNLLKFLSHMCTYTQYYKFLGNPRFVNLWIDLQRALYLKQLLAEEPFTLRVTC
uniref:Uncharacterized protein n=1 Tax=Glossina pallidipes TaxID=7398 RepID=A0A1A9Z0P1_GLOPL